MFKFVHTADWQLGAPNQPLACQRPLAALVAAARAAQTQFIICAGDIFHKHNPDQQTKDYLLQTLLEHQDIFFAFLSGNHDYTSRDRTYTSLHYIALLAKSKKITNAWVLEPNRSIAFKEVILWAPANWEDIKQPLPFQKNGKHIIALWHGIVPGLNIKNGIFDADVQQDSAAALQANAIDYVALGDVHKQFQVNPRCYYSGALTQTSYVDDLGALLVTLDGTDYKVQKLFLDLPKKVNFLVDYWEGKHTEEDIIIFVKNSAKQNNLVKLKFNLPIATYAAINKTYVIEQLKNVCLGVIFDNDPVVTTRNRKNMDEVSQAKTFEDEISIVLENEDFGLNKTELKKRILEIIIHSELE